MTETNREAEYHEARDAWDAAKERVKEATAGLLEAEAAMFAAASELARRKAVEAHTAIACAAARKSWMQEPFTDTADEIEARLESYDGSEDAGYGEEAGDTSVDEIHETAALISELEPLPEGFTPWSGGECPVDPDCRVQLVFGHGSRPATDWMPQSIAKYVDWQNSDPLMTPVIGYRVVSEGGAGNGAGEGQETTDPFHQSSGATESADERLAASSSTEATPTTAGTEPVAESEWVGHRSNMMPVAGHQMVRVRFKGGEGLLGFAREFDWSQQAYEPITAYRKVYSVAEADAPHQPDTAETAPAAAQDAGTATEDGEAEVLAQAARITLARLELNDDPASLAADLATACQQLTKAVSKPLLMDGPVPQPSLGTRPMAFGCNGVDRRGEGV